jgi:hypothetical protein
LSSCFLSQILHSFIFHIPTKGLGGWISILHDVKRSLYVSFRPFLTFIVSLHATTLKPNKKINFYELFASIVRVKKFLFVVIWIGRMSLNAVVNCRWMVSKFSFLSHIKLKLWWFLGLCMK